MNDSVMNYQTEHYSSNSYYTILKVIEMRKKEGWIYHGYFFSNNLYDPLCKLDNHRLTHNMKSYLLIEKSLAYYFFTKS